VTTIDHWIAGLGHGGGIAIALITALLLGLRHATDPDHLTAVSTLALSDERRGARRAGVLGLSWGLGHATTLVAFGLPALLLRGYLPDPVDRAAEALIGAVIIGLAVRLLVRWRRGYFHSHPHRHGERWHTHPHAHAGEHAHALDHEHRHEDLLGRSPLAAYGIGLMHGMGGSAGVTLLLIAAISDRVEATVALVIFALATAVSMSVLSAGFGTVIASRSVAQRLEQAVPLLGLLSLCFGVYYGLVAVAA
jgi:ABC-type nickel/cobalt efflux system permease component RcnA